MAEQVLKVLGAKKYPGNRYPSSDLRNAKRRPYGSMSSLPSSVSSRPFREKKKVDDRKKVKDLKVISCPYDQLCSKFLRIQNYGMFFFWISDHQSSFPKIRSPCGHISSKCGTFVLWNANTTFDGAGNDHFSQPLSLTFSKSSTVLQYLFASVGNGKYTKWDVAAPKPSLKGPNARSQ